jgi:hypothetical protein
MIWINEDEFLTFGVTEIILRNIWLFGPYCDVCRVHRLRWGRRSERAMP